LASRFPANPSLHECFRRTLRAVDREVRLSRVRTVSVVLGFGLVFAAVIRLAAAPPEVWAVCAVVAFGIAATDDRATGDPQPHAVERPR
jgi:hypothetical protein